MKKISKFLLIFLMVATFAIITNVSTVDAGYTYSHKGQPIYSTEGLTTNQEPYRASDLGIQDSDFTSPQDLYIFTDSRVTVTDDTRDNQTIYITDNKSNKLFSWDGYLSQSSRKTVINYTIDIIDENGEYIYDTQKLMELKSNGAYVVRRSVTITGMDTMAAGTTQQIDYVVTPIKDAANSLGVSGEVVWTSSDRTIATVDENGVVTAVAPSTTASATITCALADYPAVAARINISVRAQGSADLATAQEATNTSSVGSLSPSDLCDSKITVSVKQRLSLQEGQNTFELEPVKTAIASSLVQSQDFEYSSSNEEVLTVSESGLLTAVSVGQSTITISDSLNKSLSFDIEVVDADTDVSTDALQEKEETFESILTIIPSGLSCSFRKYNRKLGTDYIYLCDTTNNQILVADASKMNLLNSETEEYSMELANFFVKPVETAYSQYSFRPVKIVIDDAARMFVISDGTYQGIVQLSRRGEFDRFVGVNYVSLTTWDIIWRQLSTEAQLAASTSILNTTFTSICIDNVGFIYATSQALYDSADSTLVSDSSKMIKKINHSGKDVLYRNGYQPPQGDFMYVQYSTDSNVRGPSRFTSITVNEYGVYTVADGKMGKLFTYDENGNLLYISGGGGKSSTTITSLKVPQSIKYQGENLLVLDSENHTINVFQPTQIAVYINKAVEYQYNGDLISAQNEWQNVKNLNSNYEYAYVGIGKVLYTEAVNSDLPTQEKMEMLLEAMENFEIGFNRNYYSRAYKIYRDYNISRWFEPVMYTVLALIVLYTGYHFYRLKKYGRKEETGIGDE